MKWSFVIGISALSAAALAQESRFTVSPPQVVVTGNAQTYFSQTRAAVIPGAPPRYLLTAQETEVRGTHTYRDLFMLQSDDGTTWSKPERIPELTRRKHPDGFERVFGDVTPKWHPQSHVVLATGKIFNFRDGRTEDRSLEQVAYAVFDPGRNRWSEVATLALPELDHSGARIVAPNSGCVQRVDLPGGDILLPIRYRRNEANAPYVTLVARCGFDGTKLIYKEHGTELAGPASAQLFEPSLTAFQGGYYLTLRSDKTGFVTRSRDGLTFEPVREWLFDDGAPVGSYNTQQHWATHSDHLSLVYTRRGANNDHVFRHRAPLFMAEVDPNTLRLVRATERIVVPETGVDLGNFGVEAVSAAETWVVTTEMGVRPGAPEARRAFIVKIGWKMPNRTFVNSP